MTLYDTTFRTMGGDVRLLVGPPADPRDATAEQAAEQVRRLLERLDATLSRFDPDSELSRLNADPRAEVPASGTLRALVTAALWAARATGGLVDPALLPEIAAAGYARSRAGAQPGPLRAALAAAPPRRPARPRPGAPWAAITVDDARGTVTRPPGLALDSGGCGKGLAADLAARALADRERFVVDCAGDLVLGGTRADADPIDVAVEDPFAGGRAHTLTVTRGAVATSGIARRLWRHGDGHAHHLLDPSTGAPAWTGVVAATALAPTALRAETLAKAALLSGPVRARRLLAPEGGVLVRDDGTVAALGAARRRPRVTRAQLGMAA
jgi:thiamine biosynthesis lipoprotein